MPEKKVMELKNSFDEIDYGFIWPEFQRMPYAIYDEEYFYTTESQLSSFELEEVGEGIYRGKIDERFLGNTAIVVDGKPIAIWDASTIGKAENNKLTATIVHEMFHAYQHNRNESRFPNELQGIQYPMMLENLYLRYIERELLLHACIEEDDETKRHSFYTFLQLRKKREQLIGEYIDYEKAIETVEGTAVYVEFQTYLQLQNEKVSVEEYMNNFNEINLRNLKIRFSSYYQGLLLALIADSFLENNWKVDFMNSPLMLCNFIEAKLANEFKEKQVQVNIEYLKDEYKEEREQIRVELVKWEAQKDKVFENFERNSKKQSIKKPFKITGFDPMNVVKKDNRVIHQNFLKIDTGQGDEVLSGPVLTVIGSHLFDVRSIEW